MLKVFLLITALSATVICSPTSHGPDYQDKPGYCRIEDDRYIKQGEQGPGPLGECSRLKCVSGEPGRIGISGVGCGTFVPRQGCHLSEYDYSKRYPDCCPHSVCPEDNVNNIL